MFQDQCLRWHLKPPWFFGRLAKSGQALFMPQCLHGTKHHFRFSWPKVLMYLETISILCSEGGWSSQNQSCLCLCIASIETELLQYHFHHASTVVQPCSFLFYLLYVFLISVFRHSWIFQDEPWLLENLLECLWTFTDIFECCMEITGQSTTFVNFRILSYEMTKFSEDGKNPFWKVKVQIRVCQTFTLRCT